MFKNIKTTLNKTPKYVSLVLLTAGFIYSGRELAQSDTILTCGVILLALFLTKEASK